MSSSDVRARYRTPMQWNANANAGFTSGQAPWLKVNEDYQEINVDKQSKMKNSHLKVKTKFQVLQFQCLANYLLLL